MPLPTTHPIDPSCDEGTYLAPDKWLTILGPNLTGAQVSSISNAMDQMASESQGSPDQAPQGQPMIHLGFPEHFSKMFGAPCRIISILLPFICVVIYDQSGILGRPIIIDTRQCSVAPLSWEFVASYFTCWFLSERRVPYSSNLHPLCVEQGQTLSRPPFTKAPIIIHESSEPPDPLSPPDVGG
jgi:hypothetical protein